MRTNKVEVECTAACPVCGKWNSVVFFSNGKESWDCFNHCQDLPGSEFTVIRSSVDRKIYVEPKSQGFTPGKILGQILAKNFEHAMKIQFHVEHDYRTKRKSDRKGWTKAK